MDKFFQARNWKVFPFQKKTWQAYRDGKSGLVHAPTGTGKTYAVWAPPLIEWMEGTKAGTKRAPRLSVLWLTPLRALVEDTTRTLLELVEELQIPWTVESRTGDSSSSSKARQRKKFPSRR